MTKITGDGFTPRGRTVAEKVVAALRQPLLTFAFPETKARKPEFPPHEKPVGHEKPMVREKTGKEEAKGAAQPRPPDGTAGRRTAAAERDVAMGLLTPLRDPEGFEKILFVLRARERNGHREFAKVLRVERIRNGSRLVATDGRRLHVAEIRARIRPGDYKPVATKDVVRLGEPIGNTQFPDWERAVPKDAMVCGCFNMGTRVKGKTNHAHEAFEKATGEKVNPRYLADLTKNPWVVYRQKEKRKALLLEERGSRMRTYAVIMPLSS